MADFIMRNVPGYVPGRGSTPGGPAAAGGRATASSRATHDPTAKKPEAPPPEVVNSSTDAPVFRGDGIQLFGLDAELELKARAKRDPNIERYIEEWIEALTGEQLAPKGDLSESLKNGVMMCKLVNVIHPGIVKAINMRPIALMEMENIGFYLKACWTLGVPSGELFVTSDLYLKKGIPAVLANLISLARVAQAKESLKDKPVLACLPPLKVADPNAPVSERPARPMLQKSATDSKLASRWNKVAAGEKPEAAAPAADSLEADPEYVSSGLMADQLNALKKRLEKELAEKAELKKAKQTLEEQLMKLQKPVDAAEEDSKKEAETRKALATAEFAALQQELSTLRDKNARKSIMLKDSVSRQEQMQRQLEEKNRLEEEVKRLRSMEEDLKQAKAKGEVAETLEREVKDLREKNYRKSIMLRETVATQQQLQQQLGAQAGLEEEVKRLRSLEGEVERLRMQGKDSAAHEAEVKQLREELKEKYLLEQELKKLRGLEGQMQQMKAAGQDTAGIEMMAKQVRDVSNRRSILIQQKHATATIGSTAKGARSNTAASPLTPVARPAPAAAQAKDDLSWLKASDEHLARSQADVDEEAKRIKQLTAQIEQLKSERRESAAQQIVTELGQLNARHQRKVRIHQKALQDRQEYDNGRQALESIEREISRARAEGGVVAEMEAEFKQLKEANDKKGALIRENLQRIAQLEGMAADKLPAPPSALPPPVPTLGVTPPSGPTPGASPRKDVAKARSTTASMAVLPSDDARTGRSATSAGTSQVTSELEQQIKQLREQNARKSVALKDAAQVQKMLDMHMKEKESLEKEVTRMKNMEAEVKKLRRQGKETEQLEKEMNSLKAVNDKKNEELKRAEAALEKEVSEKADLEAEVQRLKSLEDELVRLRAEDAKSKSAYESELNQLRANASRKSMMLKDAMKQQQTMQTQLADRAALEAEVVSLRQLHGQIEVTKQQYEAQMREAAALQEQLKRQMEEKTALQAEVKKMKALERELNDLRSAGKDAQAMEDEIKQLRAAGAQAKSAKDSVALQAELNVLREKERANSTQMKQLQSKLAELEEEKSNLEAELASQLETNATQIDQLLQMESDLREAREKAAEAEVLQEEVALLKLELETAAESGASASAPDVDISKFESKIASLTEELLKLKEAEIKTEKLEKHISELEGEVIHLRVSAKDAEALEREVELLRQQTAELQAAQLTNPYEGEMHAMEEEMNKMRKVKEEDDRELFDLRLKVKMQEEQLKKAAAARPVPVPGAVEGTSPTAGGGADPALQAKLQQLQEALMKEKMEKVSVTKQLIDLKTNMTRARSDSSSAAQTREIQQLRAVIAREQQDKQRYIEMLQQQGLIGAASDSAAKQNKMAALEAVLARVLNSKSVEFSDVAKFNDLFKSDAGRRVFTRMLKKQMKETTSLLLSDNSFDILLFIFNTVLQNQDESKSKDFRSCKIVMYASCALGKRGADGRADFIQYHIQGYDIWRNLGFWEQYFYDEVARKYKEQSPSSAAHTDEAEKLVAKQFTENVIPVLISSFAHDMIITWKVPADKVREFAANMSVVNNLPDRVQEQLKSDVAFYEASLTSPQKRKELEAGLKKKFRASQLFMKTFQSNQLGGPGPAAPAAGGHAPVKQPTRPMPVKQLPTPPSGADETRQRHGNTVSGPSAPPAVKPQAAALGSSAGEEEEDEDDSGMMIGKAKKWKRMSMARLASPSAPQPMKR